MEEKKLHPALPWHVSQVFAQDLQNTSLKDLHAQIGDQIDDLLFQVESKDNQLEAQYSRMSSKGKRHYLKD